MIALIIICIILLLLILLALLPLRIRVSFKESARIYIPILFFGIDLYPRKKKLKSMSAEKYRELNKPKFKKKKSKSKPKSDTETNVSENKLKFKDIRPHISEIIAEISKITAKFSRHLNVKIYSLWAVISSDDAAKTAITYGAVSSSVAVLMGLLEDNCNIKYTPNAVTGVYVDYTLGECKFECDVRFTLRLWQIISLAVSAAMSFIKTKTTLEVKNNVRKQDQ